MIFQKTHQQSFIVSFKIGSDLDRDILTKTPIYNKKNVNVLQVMPLENDWLLVELIEKERLKKDWTY